QLDQWHSLLIYKEKVLRSTQLVAKPVHHQSAKETTERDRNSPQFPYRRLHELNRPLPPSACREPPRGHPEQRAHTTSPSSCPYKQRDGIVSLSLLRPLTDARKCTSRPRVIQ